MSRSNWSSSKDMLAAFDGDVGGVIAERAHRYHASRVASRPELLPRRAQCRWCVGVGRTELTEDGPEVAQDRRVDDTTALAADHRDDGAAANEVGKRGCGEDRRPL